MVESRFQFVQALSAGSLRQLKFRPHTRKSSGGVWLRPASNNAPLLLLMLLLSQLFYLPLQLPLVYHLFDVA